MSVNDQELLRQYAEQTSQDAFAQLVARHLDLVYSAACRQVRSPQLAEEVSQSVFADLAKTAGSLKSGTLLPAWLYQVTRRTAIDVVRRESRRQARERLAVEMAAMNHTTDWTHIEPLLDEAMASLEETDRAAILLRYFKNQSLREVGLTLGTSEDAAQKRVGRAVERLRAFFARRGVTLGAGGIAAAVSANAIQAAPGGLAAAISATAALAVAQTSTTIAITKTIAMTTLQKTCLAAALAATIGTGIYQAAQAARLRGQYQTLQQQQTPLTDQLAQLQQELAETKKRAGLLAQEGGSSSNLVELMKLRAEVSRLRNEAREAAQLKAGDNADPLMAKMQSWLKRVNLLKQRLEQNPSAKIPELKLLTDQDWMLVGEANLDSETDYRKALSDLRSRAENKFVSDLQPALSRYIQANNAQFPTDLSQLQPYFDSPVDPAMLQRWQIIPASDLSTLHLGGDWIISQQAPVDDKYDTRWGIGPNGYGNAGTAWNEDGSINSAVKTLAPVLDAYKAANNGHEPVDESQILPYITTPEQMAAFKQAQAYKAKKTAGQ